MTVGLMIEIKLLTAMAPCKILHCRSPVLFFNSGLYKTLHTGLTLLSTSSLLLHTVSVLTSSLLLFRVKTQHSYMALPLAVCRSTCFQSVLFKKGPVSPSRFGLKPNSGKGSLIGGFGSSTVILQHLYLLVCQSLNP